MHGLSLDPPGQIGRAHDRDCREPATPRCTGPPPATASGWPTPTCSSRSPRTAAAGPALAGDEAVFGGGKVLRESMGQGRATRADGAPDTVITGAVILDYWGIIKADIGIRDGRIIAIGKAGNPDIMSGVHPDLVVGPSTEIIAGNGRIVTAGAIDCHVHLICPQIMDEALGSGITTIVGGRHRARPRAARPPPSPRAPGIWPGCSRRWTPGRSTSRCSARATPSAPRRCGSNCGAALRVSSCTRTGGPRRRPSTRA